MRWDDDSGWWLALIVWAIVLGPMVFAAGRSVERRHRNNKVRALLQFRAGVDEARDQLAEVLTRMGLTVDELREQADRKAELEAIILGPDDGIVIRVSGTPTKKEIEEMKSRWSENFPDNRLGILLNCDDVMVARKMESALIRDAGVHEVPNEGVDLGMDYVVGIPNQRPAPEMCARCVELEISPEVSEYRHGRFGVDGAHAVYVMGQ